MRDTKGSNRISNNLEFSPYRFYYPPLWSLQN